MKRRGNRYTSVDLSILDTMSLSPVVPMVMVLVSKIDSIQIVGEKDGSTILFFLSLSEFFNQDGSNKQRE